jgi:hypothetical protein
MLRHGPVFVARDAMTAKRQMASEQAVIEVWRDGDRLLIALPLAEAAPQSGKRPSRKPAAIKGELAVIQSLDRLQLETVEERDIGGKDIASPTPGSAVTDDPNLAAADMLLMSEDEWLVADLLALQQEARQLAKSVDSTLAQITAGCAAIKAG